MRCLSYALHTEGLSYALARLCSTPLTVDVAERFLEGSQQCHLDIQVIAATTSQAHVAPKVGLVCSTLECVVSVKEVLPPQRENVSGAAIIRDEFPSQMGSKSGLVLCSLVVVLCVGLK